MKRDNKGFSLIELVVVIAIMVIMTVGLTLSISSATNRKAKAAVDEIKSQLSYSQSLAMSKKIAYGQIVLDADGYYYFENVYGTKDIKSTRKKLYKKDDITISYLTNKDGVGSSGTVVDEGHPCILSFVKTTGAFQPMLTVADPVNSPEVFVYQTGVYCQKIIVESDNGFRRELQLYSKTGKTSIVE